MTHSEKVLALLSDGEPHSHRELYSLYVMAHSRVADLRKRGYDIRCWREGDVYLYQKIAEPLRSGSAHEPAGSETGPLPQGPSRPGTDEATRAPQSRVNPAGSPFLAHHLDRVVLDENGCWLYEGARGGGGYASARLEEKIVVLHRVTYEHFREPIPDGLHIDHLCRVRHCINPWHLEPVTSRENMLRGEHRSAISRRTGFCLRGHSLDDAYVSGGKRTCRQCQAERPPRRRRGPEQLSLEAAA